MRRRKASNRIECHLPKTDFGTVALCPLVQVGMMRMFGTNAAHAKTDLAVRGTVANARIAVQAYLQCLWPMCEDMTMREAFERTGAALRIHAPH